MARYQTLGDGQRPRLIQFDAVKFPDLRAVLEAALGPLVWFEVMEEPEAAASNAAEPEAAAEAARAPVRFNRVPTRKSACLPPWPAATRDWCCATSRANDRADDPRH